jgi:hypothetical protein
MEQLDIRTEKLWLIEQLLKIQDEVLLHRIKTFLESIFRKYEAERLIPMTLDEFYSRIEESEKALEKGEVITQDELRAEIGSWAKK